MKNALRTLYLTPLVLLGFPASFALAEDADGLISLVASLQTQLDLSDGIEIQVVIEPENPQLVSVRRSQERRDVYILSFDREFLQLLDEQELRAAIAHELGHVWIFNHHPFLQTEVLANRQALRLVPRDSLERIYQKMFTYRGESRELESFLGY